jgi:hypothetical protein
MRPAQFRACYVGSLSLDRHVAQADATPALGHFFGKTMLSCAPDFANLPPSLSTIFAKASETSFFNHPAWYRVLSETVLTTDHAPRFYVAGSVALPLAVPKGKAGRRLVGLTNYYSCQYHVLRATDDPATDLAMIAADLAAERPGWQAITLSPLDDGDPATPLLEAALSQAGFSIARAPAFGTWYERTAQMSFRDYLASRPSSLRNTWRRRRAKLEQAGRLRIRHFDDEAELEDGVRDYQTVYEASWKKSEPYPRFIPELIRAAAALGALRLGMLYLDDAPVAAQIWLVWRGRATIYKLAHDARFDQLSPGTALTMSMAEHVLEKERPHEVDFGRGDDPYKKLWLPQRRQLWQIEAANPRTIAGLQMAARQKLRPLVHRVRAAMRSPP